MSLVELSAVHGRSQDKGCLGFAKKQGYFSRVIRQGAAVVAEAVQAGAVQAAVSWWLRRAGKVMAAEAGRMRSPLFRVQ